MPVERTSGGTSLIAVLDRVLDKGIVIDAWVRVSLVGIDLITVEARVVVASIDTYLKYSEAVGSVTPASRPAVDGRGSDAVIAENAALRAQIAGTRRETTAARRLRRPCDPTPRCQPRRGAARRSSLPIGSSWRRHCSVATTSRPAPSAPSTGSAARPPTRADFASWVMPTM